MNRGWTIVVMDHEDGEARQFAVSPRLARTGAAVGAFLALTLLAAVGIVAFDSGARLRAARLQATANEMRVQLLGLEDGMVSVKSKIDDLSDRDAEFRILAGLDPIDPEVMLAGVGGPGSRSFDSYSLGELDPASGMRAFDLYLDLEAAARTAEILSASLAEATDSIRYHRDLLESTPSIMPTKGWISSGYSHRRLHPIHNEARPHYAVDIAARRGTHVWATAKGRVVRAEFVIGYGYTVDIDHGFGFMTRYAHASELLVRRGQLVRRGDVIALVGSTGTATSTHVHYEVHVNGVPQNPRNYFFPAEIRD